MTERSDSSIRHSSIVLRHFYEVTKMRDAKDYIIFPLDVASEEEAKRYVELLADRVGLFKVGLELFIRFGPEIVRFIKSAGSA
ncbi:MAG: hypothetical protein JRE36_00675, partial [Deltaproteobacteria bacterium]|nr:hypothetical protein [Deltaproteobacteria bacterium]